MDGRCGIKMDELNQLNDPDAVTMPQLVQFAEHGVVIEEIQCGNAHSYCRSTDNKHYMFGMNYDYECLMGIRSENNTDHQDDGDGDEDFHFLETPTCVDDIISSVF